MPPSAFAPRVAAEDDDVGQDVREPVWVHGLDEVQIEAGGGGPLAGVLCGELLGGKGLLPAGRSTWGTLLGTTAGIIMRVIIAAIMIAWFLVAALWA